MMNQKVVVLNAGEMDFDGKLDFSANVIITPHMGWKGMETRRRLVGVIAENIRSFFDGSPVNVVSD